MTRIAFCGASGTGKTTLTRQLAAALGLPVPPSMAREAAASLGLASPYDADIRAPGDRRIGATAQRERLQRLITHRRIAWQQEHAERGFVADRTSYDDLAYCVMHGVSARLLQELSEAVALQNQTLEPTYHAVVLCPLESFWHHGGDPARVDDLAYHKQFQRTLLALLDGAGIQVDTSLASVSDLGRGDWLARRFNLPGIIASP